MAAPDEGPIRELLAQRRRSEAFELLMRMYRDKAYRLAYSILGNEALAEEAAQDAFLRAWQGLGEFRSESSLGTWLYAITRNTALTALARTRTRQHAPLTDASGVASPSGSAASGKDIDAMVNVLPENYRRAVRLFYLEERNYEEVARMLGLPVGTVKTHLHRARKELAQALVQAKMGKGARR